MYRNYCEEYAICCSIVDARVNRQQIVKNI